MELYQMRYFVALCKENNFTRAAKRCAVSQPSLTNGILSLEKELGGPLFNRRPLVHLTPAGAAVRPYFEQILETVNDARSTAEGQMLETLVPDGRNCEPGTGDRMLETGPPAVDLPMALHGGDGDARSRRQGVR